MSSPTRTPRRCSRRSRPRFDGISELRRVTFILCSPDFKEPAEIVATVDSLPRTGEQLVMDGRTYRVKVVLHNYDEADVYVYADEDPPPIGS